jgi:hypothetical protein
MDVTKRNVFELAWVAAIEMGCVEILFELVAMGFDPRLPFFPENSVLAVGRTPLDHARAMGLRHALTHVHALH